MFWLKILFKSDVVIALVNAYSWFWGGYYYISKISALEKDIQGLHHFMMLEWSFQL